MFCARILVLDVNQYIVIYKVMKKTIRLLFILFCVSVFLALKTFAITDKPDFIEFDDVLKQAKAQSYDIQIADYDVFIAKQGVRTARSEYFPKINASVGTEYTKNFKDYRNSVVTVVGDAFVNPYTRFQSLMGITLSYNVFDFGVRKGRMDLAKEDVQLKELLEKEQFQELELTILDTYSKLFILKKQIEINQEILLLAKKNLDYKTRLFEAKEIAKTELDDQKVAVQKYERRILELNSLAQESLNWLTFYTKQEYNLDNLNVKALKKSDINPMEFNDYTKSLTWLIQEKEIKKKELALKVAKKNNYPKVNAYSRYYMYGSDHSSYKRTMDDLGASNYTIGATVFMPVFDGFKNSAEIQTANLELQQQLIKRDKAIAQFMTRLATMRTNFVYLGKQIETDEKLLCEIDGKYKSIKKLVDKKISTPIELNEVRIQLLEQQIELEKNKTSTIAITKAIQALTSY